MDDEPTNPLVNLRKKVAEQRVLVAERHHDDMLRGAEYAYDAVLNWIDELLPVKALPCPFCGSLDSHVKTSEFHNQFQWECGHCSTETGMYSRFRYALEAWNRRRAPEQAQTTTLIEVKDLS